MDGKEDCETDIFFKRFEEDNRFMADLAEIKAILRNMGKFGASSERFRPEDNAHALPKTKNGLRLYCIRCNSGTVILCGGGKKESLKVQDSPDCLPHFKLAKQVAALFDEKILSGNIKYNGKFLEGELIFDTEII